MELVTVIVPVYNTERYLEKCLDSLHGQTYTNLEILLIDDGSCDRSREICENYCGRDSRMKLTAMEHAGVSAARNEGIQQANGDYLVFVDSDDFIHERFVEILLEAVKKSRYGVASCDTKYISQEEEFQVRQITGYDSKDIALQDYDFREKYAKLTVTAAIFRMEIVQNLRFDTALAIGEDSVFFAKVLNRSGGVCYVSGELYYYVIRKESTMRAADIKKQENEYQAWDEILEIFSRQSPWFLRQLHLERAVAFRNAFFRRCMSQKKYGEANERARRRMMMDLKYMRYEKNKIYRLKHILSCCFPRLMCMLYRGKIFWKKRFSR
jgi:glycosyltransferase involved in cell wall biosynthesis